jgi:iron-sulfur cluster insertion protein
MINLTESAQTKLEDIIKGYNDPKLKVRMYVSGGGCSGMQYGFEITVEQNEDDWIFPANNTTVLIDPISMQYIEGITVDYKDDLQGARFVMDNPKAQTTCGCGSSFSPY